MVGLRIMLVGNDAAQAKLAAIPGQVSKALDQAMGRSLDIIYRRVMRNLTGDVLHVRTGRLRQSIATGQKLSDHSGFIGTNVEYAAIHEYGGQTRPHQILPHGSALRFADPKFIGPIRRTKAGKFFKRQTAGTVFARSVNHPGSTMPARPYLRPALRDSQAEIVEAFRSGVAAVLRSK
jgi:phage gpG-like protein